MSLYVLKYIVVSDDYDYDDEEEGSSKGSFAKIN
jgi:hypothetical protein